MKTVSIDNLRLDKRILDKNTLYLMVKQVHCLKIHYYCIKLKIIKMNKTIFITGASSGLGKATAKLFAAKGWTVIVTMRNPEKETELSQLPNIHLLQLDLNNPKQIAEIASEAEKISPIDVLFNNAAYGLMGPFEGTSDEQIAHQINTNFLGTILVTKSFLPYLRSRKRGTIITVTSSTANIPYPFVAVYAATKSALETWTEGMSYELKRFGIRIKTIVPAYMQTNFGNNAQMVSHHNYQEVFNQYITAMRADSSAKRDTPESIAKIVYKAVTDNKEQLHYTAGNLSTTEYEWLNKDGIEKVISTMDKRFFGQEN
jgi:short-subunit dehydrogenase